MDGKRRREWSRDPGPITLTNGGDHEAIDTRLKQPAPVFIPIPWP